jgi:hypothetical protein
MAAKRRQETLETAGETVTSAAKTAVTAADEYGHRAGRTNVGLEGQESIQEEEAYS